MKTLKYAPLLVLSLALFPACAKKHTDAPAPVPQPIVQPSLAAEYATACRSEAPNTSQIDYVQTNGSRLRLATKLFEGNNCDFSKVTSILEVFNNYKLGAVKKDKLFEIDLHETEVRITPTSQEVSDNWNRIAYCGRNDWTANDYRVIDKRTGCMGRNNSVNQRAVFSIVQLDADRIQLGRETGPNDDGTSPEKRHNSLQTLVYIRTGSSVTLPPEDTTCPNLVGTYRCTQGDGFFAGKDANVTSITDVNNVTSVRFELSQTGTQTYSEIYMPGQPERIVRAGGMVIATRDYCQQGTMTSSVVNYREGDTRNKSLTERAFNLDARSTLVINTKTQNVVNDRPDRIENVRTECVKIQ